MNTAIETGSARLPQRVSAVVATVGAATWSQPVKSLRPGSARRPGWVDTRPAATRPSRSGPSSWARRRRTNRATRLRRRADAAIGRPARPPKPVDTAIGRAARLPKPVNTVTETGSAATVDGACAPGVASSRPDSQP
ncbi:hypothetical protein AB0M39_15535 [Streptomyces sp. NPDC051907]|uniref:hypothetical protein n=1 Tax=Streptomyces sp. NPDC051907 TaxID=3155284 RepID=UPI00341F6D8D